MIWLTGNKGMLGSAVEELLKKSGFDYTASDAEVDITDRTAVEKLIGGKDISRIINAAAYTDVDGAETEREKAFAVNAEAVRVGVFANRSAFDAQFAIERTCAYCRISSDSYRAEMMFSARRRYSYEYSPFRFAHVISFAI